MEVKNTHAPANARPLQDRIAAIAQFLTEQKGGEPFVHIFRDGNPVADAMVVVTASSGRHAQGLADGLLRLCAEIGQDYLGMEGYAGAQWILADCNDVLVHIFQPDARAIYRLEDLCLQSGGKSNCPKGESHATDFVAHT